MVPASLAHYRILRPLGAGGMGEVFLAEDTKLGRQVALKVLAHETAADPERRARFEREARAVAALNHPNIITIYSVEEQDGFLFLTMELVEGGTLADAIPRDGMTLEQFLRLAIPLADAVGAAHQRGITHRDLKPANVMVGADGRVKVLDFGLAKLQDGPLGDSHDTAVTSAQLTVDGRILGTVAYMSPEQAQGKPVDPRSDVFSLGIVLFEMATGQKPFGGDTNVSLLSAILKDTPQSVTDLRQDLPRELGRILKRCLAKDPEERYQTAKDLRNDLKALKDDYDTGELARDRTRSQISPASARRRHPLVIPLAALTAVAAVAVAGGWWYLRRPVVTAAQSFTSIKMRRLTNTGDASLAAISPDGRYFVHVVGESDKPSLWMRQVSTASNVQVVAPMEGHYVGLTFSPDGEAVLYVFARSDGPASLFQIPLLGGPPRKLVEDIDTAPAFSPDGARMAFIRGMANGEQVIFLAAADGSGERRLSARTSPDMYAQVQMAWSPDGNLIAAFAGKMPRQRSRIVLVSVATGKEQALGEPRFDFPGQLAWLRDGSSLVFDAVDQGGGYGASGQLWSMSYPGGVVRRLTTDVANYSSLAAAGDGRALVAVQHELRANLWVVPGGDTARARPITSTSNGREGLVGVDWTPDGRIVYSAMTQGSWDVWIANGDGSHPTQLTSDPGVEVNPQVLADGKGIVFISRPAGEYQFHIRAIDLDGGNPRQLLTGGGVQPGYLQAREHHIYFIGLTGGRPAAYRMPVDGGPAAPLLPNTAGLPPFFYLRGVSPDERWALGSFTDVVARKIGLAVVPIDATEPAQRTDARTLLLERTRSGFSFVRPSNGFGTGWAPGGQELEDLVLRDGAPNVWRFPLDGSAAKAVTRFSSERIFAYAWSRDGKTLAISRGTESSDVVLITDAGDAGNRPTGR